MSTRIPVRLLYKPYLYRARFNHSTQRRRQSRTERSNVYAMPCYAMTIMTHQNPFGWALIPNFCSLHPHPDISLHLEFPGSGLVNRRNVSAAASAQSCSLFLPTLGGMARLTRPRAIVCKFPVHRNYAVTSGFEPGTLPLGQHATRYSIGGLKAELLSVKPIDVFSVFRGLHQSSSINVLSVGLIIISGICASLM